MIEGSPEDLVTRVEGLESRTEDVDEFIALWHKRRPTGASPIVRVVQERAPPRCYGGSLMPTQLQDPQVRAFSSWRAIRCGTDGANPWALMPHAPGVNAPALFAALGAGDGGASAPLDVVIHIANELVDALSLLEMQPYAVGADAQPIYQPAHSTLLVRPFDARHVHFGFDGDVAFDVVTDKIQLERPAFEIVRAELMHEAASWRAPAHDLVTAVIDRLLDPADRARGVLADVREGRYDPALNMHNPEVVVVELAADPRVPQGRAALKEMLRALFPAAHARARDLDESARI